MEGVTNTSPAQPKDGADLSAAVYDTCVQFSRVDSQSTVDQIREQTLRDAMFASIACTEISERGEGALLSRVEGSTVRHLRALVDMVLLQMKPSEQSERPVVRGVGANDRLSYLVLLGGVNSQVMCS